MRHVIDAMAAARHHGIARWSVLSHAGTLAGQGRTAHLDARQRTIHPHLHPMSFRRMSFRLALPGLILAMSCRNPASDATMIEQMRQLGDELNASRQDAGAMHDQLDSLKIVVAKQDTLLRQLAGMANVPVPPR
jgi:hypothetical protein